MNNCLIDDDKCINNNVKKSPTLKIIIGVCIVLVVIIAISVSLFVYFRKRSAKKLDAKRLENVNAQNGSLKIDDANPCIIQDSSSF